MDSDSFNLTFLSGIDPLQTHGIQEKSRILVFGQTFCVGTIPLSAIGSSRKSREPKPWQALMLSRDKFHGDLTQND